MNQTTNENGEGEMKSASACKNQGPMRVMSIWSMLHKDQEYCQWDADAQGDMAVAIYKRIAGRRELVTTANVFKHFRLITED